MKNIILKSVLFGALLLLIGCKDSTDPATWDDEKINKWFDKGEWLNGWTAVPDASINRKEFVTSYFGNKERWDKAFAYLKNTDLTALEVKKHVIDEDRLYATVTEYFTKSRDVARFEAHRKYIDIQYVIRGEEMIGVAPATSKGEILQAYDESKDLEFMTVNDGVELHATPQKFFLFFPSDIHRPSLSVGDSLQVKKIVVKVKID
jgi:YhcH/YjgK/YiaL family protein